MIKVLSSTTFLLVLVLIISLFALYPSFDLALFGDDWLAFFRYNKILGPLSQTQWNHLSYFLTLILFGYLRTLIAHYSEVVTVTDATLKEMKSALDVAVRQRLDLAMKLDTYQGLTANQVEFAEAVQFLREVQHITDGLDNSMNAVDGVFSTEVGKYVANAPETPRIAPSVDVARVKLLTQGEKR